MEKTLVVIKPDAVQRGLVGKIVGRFEQKGLKIVGMKALLLSRDLARTMYAQHEGRDFFEPLIEFVTAGPIVAVVLEGESAVEVVRTMIGPTFGPEAPPGTIRGDFGVSRRYNLVHGSDSRESARREIALLFDGSELLEYELHGERWIYARRGDELI